MFKRTIITILTITGLTVGSLGAVYFNSPATDALSMKNFDAGNIISDAVFYDENAMTASQIQKFLNNKVPTCDTNGSQPYLNTGKTVKQYWSVRGEKPPYTCLKDWKQKTPSVTGESGICSYMKGYSSRTAAQIISDVAKACGISPKVLLVLLQKEQSLVTDTSPLRGLQYGSATGMGCPDTAGCDPRYDGYFNQVYGAARQYKLYRAAPSNYNYVAGRTNYILYNPNAACGGSNVYIKNQATAGLYNYTPYQPNKATRDVPYGHTATCGAYGNKNFWYLFTNWFGSTTYAIKGSIEKFYNSNDGVSSLGSAMQSEKTDGNGFWWQKFEKGYIAGQSSTGYFAIKGSIGKYYDSNKGQTILGKPLNAESKDSKNIWSQKFAKGTIQGNGSGGYVSTLVAIDKYYRSGSNINKFGLPLEDRTNLGGSAWEQKFTNGYISGSAKTGYWESRGGIRNYWINTGKQTGKLGYVSSDIQVLGTGEYQLYSGGAIVDSGQNNYYSLVGSIGKKYLENTALNVTTLGLPTANEIRVGGLWQQKFKNGLIIKSGGVYRSTYGDIYKAWIDKFNGATGSMGLPIGSIKEDSAKVMVWQEFEKGFLVKSSKSSAVWESKGSIREYWASTGFQNGPYGIPTGPEVKHSNGSWSQTYENGTIRTLYGKNSGSTLNS